MKKVLFILVFLLMFSFSPQALAEGDDNFELVGGIGYNVFNLLDEEEKDFHQEEKMDDLSNGIGFYGGISNLWGRHFAFEAGFDGAYSSYDKSLDSNENIEVKNEIIGPYWKLNYIVHDNIRLNVGGGYYFFESSYETKLEENHFIKTKQGRSPALLLGTEVNYYVHDDIALSANLGYRHLEVDIDKIVDEEKGVYKNEVDISEQGREVDMSGLMLSLSFMVKF